MSKRIIIVGGGPGGYVAAIRAAQLGAEVHLIEKENIGGTCLNVGCVPTKALIHTADQYNELKKAAKHGLMADNPRIDWNVLMKHKADIVYQLVSGVAGLLESNRVTVHKGQAALKNNQTVIVNGEDKYELTGDAIILAVGSKPASIKFPGSELEGVIDSTMALELPQIPPSMTIVGGGVIGVEFAALYSALGAKITIVEMLPEILPPVDAQITAVIKNELKRRGVTIMVESSLTGVEKKGSGLIARIKTRNGDQELESQYVLVAVGRKPNTDTCRPEAADIQLDRSAVAVNSYFQTNIPNIYAIGDCNGRTMLAHAASAQGIAAVEHIMGYKPSYNSNVIPYCVYCTPEIAGIGITEAQAAEKGIPFKIGRFSMAGNGKSLIEGYDTGLVKIIAEAESGKILGAHMIGPRVIEIIAEIAVAMTLGATADDIAATIHAHPTVSEAVAEAAHGVNGHAIHWPA